MDFLANKNLHLPLQFPSHTLITFPLLIHQTMTPVTARFFFRSVKNQLVEGGCVGEEGNVWLFGGGGGGL